MTRTSFVDSTALMSPRTAKYVAAMIQAGDSFDYGEWLKSVREQETEANQRLNASALGNAVSAEMATRRDASPTRLPRRHVPASTVSTVTRPGTIRRSRRTLRGTKSQNRLRA